MKPILADQDFNEHILRGLLRLVPGLDILRSRDLGLGMAADASIIAAAAESGRVVLSHDIKTMPSHLYSMASAGLPVPPLVICPQRMRMALAIDHLGVLFGATRDGEIWPPVTILPLR